MYTLVLSYVSVSHPNTDFFSAMQNLAAITNLPGYVGGLNPEQQFRFAQATGAAAAAAGQTAASSLISDNTASNLGGIWPGIQQSPVNMVPFQIPSIKLESSLSWRSAASAGLTRHVQLCSLLTPSEWCSVARPVHVRAWVLFVHARAPRAFGMSHANWQCSVAGPEPLGSRRMIFKFTV